MSLFMRKKYKKVETYADRVLSIDYNNQTALFYKGKIILTLSK